MIDVHTHAFPERLMNAIYAWFRRDGWKIPYDGKQTEELFAEHRKQGMERFFVLLYAHKPGMARSLNDWLADLATVHPEVVPIGCVHQDDDVSAETEYCLGELGFAGMKLHCAVQRVSMDDPRLDPLYETLIAFNKPLIVHAGTAPGLHRNGGRSIFRPGHGPVSRTSGSSGSFRPVRDRIFCAPRRAAAERRL